MTLLLLNLVVVLVFSFFKILQISFGEGKYYKMMCCTDIILFKSYITNYEKVIQTFIYYIIEVIFYNKIDINFSIFKNIYEFCLLCN